MAGYNVCPTCTLVESGLETKRSEGERVTNFHLEIALIVSTFPLHVVYLFILAVIHKPVYTARKEKGRQKE